MTIRITATWGLTLLGALAGISARADDSSFSTISSAEIKSNSDSAYFENWFKRVDAALASQPKFASPVFATNPLLLELLQYDQYWQTLPTGIHITNYDAGKGVHLIPADHVEVFLQAPPYLERSSAKNPAAGFADWPFLTLKYRIAAASAENGNYVVSALLSAQAPTGVAAFTNNAYIITPTLGLGKGWGNFDVQATIGVPSPTNHIATLGFQLTTNLVLQYHLMSYLWPEFEVNDTNWLGGLRRGKNQVFLTPGLVVGASPIHGRLTAGVGFGYQIAVSPKRVSNPITPLYDRNWIVTLRLFF